MDEDEVNPFVWKSNGKQVDKCARLIGLPEELTEEQYYFAEKSGLLNVFRQATLEPVVCTVKYSRD